MICSVKSVFVPKRERKLLRPLILTRVPAGFPSPADDYIEGRIDLNRDLIRHPLATFYVRVVGDSMEPVIQSGALIVVDRMLETKDGDIVIARVDSELCVKRLRMTEGGAVWLSSENARYQPIVITEEMDFEVWGKVSHAIHTF
ncbi:MAG TPA: translesion error-prone DNA polymerase V autoproteolytic subunit [Pyrinomonadaceae bacterium]|jgi:DNA polymerase V